MSTATKPAFKPTIHKHKDVRGRRITGYHASFGPIEGEFRESADSAIDALRERIESFDGSYTPIILECRGCVVLVWRDGNYGWSYKTIQWPGETVTTGTLFGNSVSDRSANRTQCEAMHNLAQATWRIEDGDGHPLFDDGVYWPCSATELARYRSEFRSWAAFQTRAHRAKTEFDMSPDDAHAYAGRNPGRPELWYYRDIMDELKSGARLILPAGVLDKLSEQCSDDMNNVASAVNENSCGPFEAFIVWYGDNAPEHIEYRDVSGNRLAFASV